MTLLAVLLGLNLGALLTPMISPAFHLFPVPLPDQILAYEFAPRVSAAPIVSVSVVPSATVVFFTTAATTASLEAVATSSLQAIFQRWKSHLLLWVFLFALPFAFDLLMLGVGRYRSLVASASKHNSDLQRHGHDIRNLWSWAQGVDHTICLRGRDLFDYAATLRKHAEQLASIDRAISEQEIAMIINRLSSYSAGILQDLPLRLNRTEHDYTVVSQQLEALSQQLEVIQTERQLERTQIQDLELRLRAHVPRNIYANNVFQELEVKIPAGDTAGLIKAWMKATEMQPEISNVNIKRVTESVQALPSNSAPRAAT
jgi:hypothetical protein